MNEGHTAGEGYSKDIKIGHGAWIGSNTTILSGVTIGEKAVIAPGSVISMDVPPNTMVSTIGNVRRTLLPKKGTLRL